MEMEVGGGAERGGAEKERSRKERKRRGKERKREAFSDLRQSIKAGTTILRAKKEKGKEKVVLNLK